MNIEVVNLTNGKYLPRKTGVRYIYIGRSRLSDPVKSFGNPFTHLTRKTLAEIRVNSREEAIQAYRDWLDGTAWTNVEPARRLWIREQIAELGKAGHDLMLACWCFPLGCHGDVLRDMILDVHRKWQEANGH